MTLRHGDTVRMIHNYGREATVSSVAKDGTIMLCCYIAGRYQLRGPFAATDVELVEPTLAEAQALAREQAETITADSWPGGIHGQ